jgi:hypothetical protein
MASLMWIVKTPGSTSLSHSEKQEQRQVFSQAQRTSRHQKAAEKQRLARCQRPFRKNEALPIQACISSDGECAGLGRPLYRL